MDWNTIQLAFQFLPRLPTIERGAAKLRDDDGFMALVASIPEASETYNRLAADPEVQAMVGVFRDLFKALAIDGGSTRVAQVLINHGADEQAVRDAAEVHVGPTPEGPGNPQI